MPCGPDLLKQVSTRLDLLGFLEIWLILMFLEDFPAYHIEVDFDHTTQKFCDGTCIAPNCCHQLISSGKAPKHDVLRIECLLKIASGSAKR